MNIGERILSEIVKQGMVSVSFPDPEATHVFTWNANAEEQLSAVVATEQEHDRQLLVGALDSLGCALASHNHQWTDGERTIYEQALKVLNVPTE